MEDIQDITKRELIDFLMKTNDCGKFFVKNISDSDYLELCILIDYYDGRKYFEIQGKWQLFCFYEMDEKFFLTNATKEEKEFFKKRRQNVVQLTRKNIEKFLNTPHKQIKNLLIMLQMIKKDMI